MKYCIHCGKQLDNGAAFCPYCGYQQPQVDAESEPKATRTAEQPARPVSTPVTAPASKQAMPESSQSKSILMLVLGLVLIIAIVFGGKKAYSTYQRNHLSEQDIADISQRVTTKYLGSDNKVYYSKADNLISIVPGTSSNLYSDLEDVLDDSSDASEMTPYVTKLKKISTEMAEQMPTKDHNVKVQLVNPDIHERYLYTVTNGTVNYDFTD